MLSKSTEMGTAAVGMGKSDRRIGFEMRAKCVLSFAMHAYLSRVDYVENNAVKACRASCKHVQELSRKREAVSSFARRVRRTEPRLSRWRGSRGRNSDRPEAGERANGDETMRREQRVLAQRAAQRLTMMLGWCGLVLQPDMARCRLECYRVASVPPTRWAVE